MRFSRLLWYGLLLLIILMLIIAGLLRVYLFNGGPIRALHIGNAMISFLLTLFGVGVIIASIGYPIYLRAKTYFKRTAYFFIGLGVTLLGCSLFSQSIQRILSNCTPFVDC